MNKNVQIEVFTGADGESEYLVLPENTSLTIKRSSNLFGRGDIFSYNFRVVAAANRHIIKNAATAHGELLRDLLQDVPANLYVYGAMYSSGYLKVGNKDFDEDGEIDLSFYGGRKSFDKMISNKNANDIPLLSKVQVGWAHDRTCKVTGSLGFQCEAIGVETFGFPVLKAIFEGLETVRYPKFVVVKGDVAEYMSGGAAVNPQHVDFTNTYHAFDDSDPMAHPYCNIPVAYTRYVRIKNPGSKEYTDDKRREYHISDAGRINSAPNFFVMYWLRCLFKSLDIDIVENQLASVEDFTRLFFVNTSLRYDEDVKTPENLWSLYRENEVSDIPGKSRWNTMYGGGFWCNPIIEKDNSKWEIFYDQQAFQSYGITIRQFVDEKERKPSSWEVYLDRNDKFYPAYATPKNFPEESVESVLEVLEKAFGVRFVFAEDMKSVRIVLLSKILTQNRSNRIRINVTDVAYKQPDIEGVRWKYGGGSGVQYNYPPFDRILYPRAKPEDTGYTIYNRWSFDKTYPTIVEEVSDTNATCYIDPRTGNAYRIAVDKDTLVNGSLIEVGAYQAAVEGNVDTDDDYIKEETIDFTPLQMNRIDGQYALYVGDDMKSSFYDPERPAEDTWYSYESSQVPGRWIVNNKSQGYGQLTFVGNVHARTPAQLKIRRNDEDMWITAEDAIKIVAAVGFAACYPDNFDYDGEKNSPIEEVVDGLTLCLLRGPADSVESFMQTPCPPHDDASFVNGWETVGGTGINAHPDSCTEEGTLFDYNGGLLGLKDVELDSYSQRLVRAERVCEDWIDSSWAPKIAAATPRFMNGYYPPSYTDEQAASVSSPYDGCASIMYCMADAYVVFHYTDGNQLREEVRRFLFTPLRANGEPINYATYKSYCNIIRGYFAAAETAMATRDDFATTMEAALALMAADTDHPNYAAIPGQILPVWNVNEGAISTFAAKWREVMYGDEAPAQEKGGRFSLKLRAEKPNPFYVSELPDIISSKRDAALAMTKLFTTTNTNLLTRPKVSSATMRAAGWRFPGDGYATLFSIGIGLHTSDGVFHEILWTPIKPDGTVISQDQLIDYVDAIDAVSTLQYSELASYDTLHLMLDIDTNDTRAEILHQLQAIYYADYGEQVSPVDISPINKRYLEIVNNDDVKRRGLVDVLLSQYKEYLLYGRTATFSGVMPYEDFLAIDELALNEIGGCTGLIKNMQAALGGEAVSVKIELLYL